MQVRRAIRPARGFTLMDVLVSILVLTIGVTGLSGLQLVSLRQSMRSRELTEAMQLARAKAEELSIMPLPLPAPPAKGEDLDARGCLLTDTRAFCATRMPGLRYVRTWLIDTTNQRQFTVTTRWLSFDGKQHQVVVAGAR